MDGSFFHGNASAASVKTKKQLEAELAALEQDIDGYLAALERGDADAAAAEATTVRAIAAYVEMLDLERLGFRHAGGALTVGQPAYAPGDLLKLYLYGYQERVHSSRRLEAECRRNLEVMWLLNGLRPNYHTIADFRKNNAAALKAANREFVLLCRELGLISGTRVGVDGSFFHGNASAASVKTKKQLEAELAALEQDIDGYLAALERGDADAAAAEATTVSAQQLADLQARAQRRREQLEELARTGETQISRTDPDARRLSKNGQKVTGYNVQSVVDDQHHLILTHEVTNAGNDLGQLVPMAEQARQMLLDGQTTEAAQPLEVLADAGYFTESDIAACASRGIVPYVPVPEKTGAAERAGRLSAREFVYDAEQDRYRCPGGEALHPYGQPDTRNGVNYRRYRSRASVCQSCPLKAQCLPPAGKRREILRSEHAEAVERHRERMAAAPQVMRQRAALCEHPFGTLKRWLGWDHFLVRGFDKVRGEMAMIVHSYNFRRVLSILGVAAFIAYCQARGVARGFLAAWYGLLERLCQPFWGRDDPWPMAGTVSGSHRPRAAPFVPVRFTPAP
ncbi:IS1182 family transposase [Thioalkalivibrio nitratireducens]|uniref:IS1182 family transposase n=1 Tax=Thioalkalivibrio nitratireducens TaxID=186931 RepID=UPI0006942A80|nr:IS1182 family transposase [Thioalkalivibrio nitratireducens]